MNTPRAQFLTRYLQDITEAVSLHYGPVPLIPYHRDEELLVFNRQLSDDYCSTDLRTEQLTEEFIQTYPNQIVSVVHQTWNGCIRNRTFSYLPVANGNILQITFRIPQIPSVLG